MNQDGKRPAETSPESNLRAVDDINDDAPPETKRSKVNPPPSNEVSVPDLKCPNCGKTNFCISQALVSHMSNCGAADVGARSLTLRPSCLESERERLSDFNLLVADSIELVELTDVGMEQMSHSQRQRKPLSGNIGIRCRYCAEAGRRQPGSESYPDRLQNLSHNVYNLTNRHLVKECRNIPESTRENLIETKKITTSQSMEKARLGLPVYLKLVTKEFGLIDNGKKQGIQCTMAGGNQQTAVAVEERTFTSLHEALSPGQLAIADEDVVDYTVTQQAEV